MMRPLLIAEDAMTASEIEHELREIWRLMANGEVDRETQKRYSELLELRNQLIVNLPQFAKSKKKPEYL